MQPTGPKTELPQPPRLSASRDGVCSSRSAICAAAYGAPLVPLLSIHHVRAVAVSGRLEPRCVPFFRVKRVGHGVSRRPSRNLPTSPPSIGRALRAIPPPAPITWRLGTRSHGSRGRSFTHNPTSNVCSSQVGSAWAQVSSILSPCALVSAAPTFRIHAVGPSGGLGTRKHAPNLKISSQLPHRWRCLIEQHYENFAMNRKHTNRASGISPCTFPCS